MKVGVVMPVRPAERWQTIPWAPCYEVSEEGRCRRRLRGHNVPAGAEILGSTTNGGYRSWSFRVDGRTVYELAHRTMARVFLGEPPTSRHQVNHKNGLKTDNRPENLEWVTQYENMAHAREIGRVALGKARPFAKLSDEDVRQMRAMRSATGPSYRSIAKEFGISTMVAYHIINGHTWRHVA